MKKMLQSVLAVSMVFQFVSIPIMAQEETNEDDVIVEEIQNETTDELTEEVEVEDNAVTEEEIVDEQTEKVESADEELTEDDVVDYEDEVSTETTESKGTWKKESNGKWKYYLNATEYVKNTVYRCSDGSNYYFDENGYMLTNKWYNPSDNDWYYYGSDGKEVSGWKKINNKWYCFTPGSQNVYYGYSPGHNRMVINEWIQIDNTYYYFDKNGAWIDYSRCGTGWIETEHGRCYFDSSSQPYTGWLKEDEYWYYIDNGYMEKNSIRDINNKTYYFDEEGHMVTNQLEDYGGLHYFGQSGAAVSGWQKVDDKWYYFLPSNYANKGYLDYCHSMAVSTELVIDGNYYVFDDNGDWIKKELTVTKGWNKIKGKWYYYDTPTKAHNGWLKSGNYWYYIDNGYMMQNEYLYNWTNSEYNFYHFDNNGHMETNKWNQDSWGGWYYYGSDGKRVFGWNKIKNVWYYFRTIEREGSVGPTPVNWGYRSIDVGVMAVSWEYYIDGKWYAFDENGAWQKNGIHKSGWVYQRDSWYYYDTPLIPHNGWLKDGGYWYYIDHGYMVVNRAVWVNGDYYYLDENGHIVSNKWDDQWHRGRYFGDDGTAVSGWHKIDNLWYYFNQQSGNMMARNCTLSLSDGTYTFDDEGHWIKNNEL